MGFEDYQDLEEGTLFLWNQHLETLTDEDERTIKGWWEKYARENTRLEVFLAGHDKEWICFKIKPKEPESD